MKKYVVIILYQPNIELINQPNKFSIYFDKVIIIDNSPSSHENEFIDIPNITYIHKPENVGIAKALNLALDICIQDGADWCLTMDQDSVFIDDDLSTFIKKLDYVDKDTAIVSPFHSHMHNKIPRNNGTEQVLSVMTSGNLLRVEAYKHIGLFDESLFIDGVDTEFCLRANSMGYRIFRYNDIILYHDLGNIKEQTVLGRNIHTLNHSPLRRYYITRNRHYIMKKYLLRYPKYFLYDCKYWTIDFLKMIAFEEQKCEKVRMVLLGFFDLFRNRMGKYNG